MLTNCLAACAHLIITVSEIQRDICEKNRHFIIPLAFDAPIRGFPSEYRHPLWYGKTRMVSLPDGEKISKIFIRFGATLERDKQTDRQTDGRTDGHRVTAIDALCIASHGKNDFAVNWVKGSSITKWWRHGTTANRGVSTEEWTNFKTTHYSRV